MIAIRRPLVLPLSMLACAVLGASCSSRDRSNAASGTTVHTSRHRRNVFHINCGGRQLAWAAIAGA